MKACNGVCRWRLLLGVASLGVFAFALVLQGAPDRPQPSSTEGFGGSGTVIQRGDRDNLITFGPGVTGLSNLPVRPSVTIDYRKDPTTQAGLHGIQAATPRADGAIAAAPGDACFYDFDCDDCNPCTLDSCGEGVCQGGTRHGYECGFDEDCLGRCLGGTEDGQHCRNDIDCCDPAGPNDGTCEFFTCTPLGSEQCINTTVPNKCDGDTTDPDRAGLNCDCPGGTCNGTNCVGGDRDTERCDCPGGACAPGFEPNSECDDTLECNGQETCTAGVCNAPTEPWCLPTEWCDESSNNCSPLCTTDSECKTALGGNDCTNEVCCVTPGGCGDVPLGWCYVDTPPCGNGGGCTEGPPIVCGLGRCCNGDACTESDYPDCTGTWFATGTEAYPACEPNVNNSPDDCPAYSSGIAPQGEFNVAVGPVVSDSSCLFVRLGDDYLVDPTVVDSAYMDIHFLRFAASVQSQARFAIEFWDATGHFIEDLYYPDGTDAGASGPAIHTVDFLPPLRIPTDGFIVFSIATNFTPGGAVSWLSTESPADVGTNDADMLFVNGSATTGHTLGECFLGGRDGQWCDVNVPSSDKNGCGAGTCTEIPDVLAFEIVGEAAAIPVGACCNSADGSCSEVLKWQCEEADGVFQGEDSKCHVCQLNGFITCDVDTDCWACDGGERIDEKCGDAACPDGELCVGGECIGSGLPCDCPGGSCEAVGPCRDEPVQCTLHGCCEDASGECAVGFCGGDPLQPCNDYEYSSECTSPDTCDLVDPVSLVECPFGWTPLGYGHNCEPNCCVQSEATGGDTCLLVDVQNITVPGFGEPPVVVTLTGSNATATHGEFDTWVCDAGPDYQEVCDPNVGCPDDGEDVGVCDDGLCVGGTNDGNACDPDAECQEDGECIRLGGWSPWNPDDDAFDPGWTEGFYIDDWANVRLQLCCSEIMTPTGLDVLQPAWGNLLSGCPLTQVRASIGVPDPIGIGYGPDNGSARGGPFCPNDDNLWQTYGPLPPGTYYYPIYSGREGTYAAPPGGTYQLSIIVGAPPEAACCLPDFACYTYGQPLGDACDPDVQCPEGHCIDGTCDGGTNDGNACDPDNDCTTGGECSSCALMHEADCDTAEGYWLAGLNLPEGMQAVITCDTGMCDIGSCCTGPGLCEDQSATADCDPATPSTCMDRILCEDTLGGLFVGGPQCDWPIPACPVCTADGEGNCFDPDGRWWMGVDRTNGATYALADEFITVGTQISEMCFQLLMGFVPGQYIEECLVPVPPDDFEIRFYVDQGGYPGAEIAGSPGKVDVSAKRLIDDPPTNQWMYSFVFDPPVPVDQDTKYWVEYSGVGTIDDFGDRSCAPYFAGTSFGNQWAFAEQDQDSGWSFEDNMQASLDWAFCLDVGIDLPPTPSGSCCECNATCTDGMTIAECMGIWIYPPAPDPSYFQDGIGGQWHAEACGEYICANQDLGVCPGASPVMGSSFKIPEVVTDGNHLVDTLCKTSDGATAYPPGSCDLEPMGDLGNDWWLEYTSTCDGNVTIDTCGDTDYDVVLIVFRNEEGTCPGKGVCVEEVCVGGLFDGYCVDSFCDGGQNHGVGCVDDGDCLGLACTVDDDCYNAEPAVADLDACLDDSCANTPNSTYIKFGVAGECYIIRIAGEGGASGRGLVDILCEAGCEKAAPAVHETLDLPFDPISQKGRYVSFSAGEEGKSQAVRMTINNAPAPYDTWNGVQLYVQEPLAYCENSGVSTPVPPATECPDAVGGLSQKTFWGASLGCDPVWTDWTQYDTVHVYDEGIIPLGVYDLQVVNFACTSLPDWENDPGAWSDLERWTQTKWGDCVENCTTIPCSPPLGTTNTSIGDVTAVLDKWKNLPGNLVKARADMEGSPAGDHRVPDQAINITDVTYVLGAFLGDQYPGPGFPPASLPPVCSD